MKYLVRQYRPNYCTGFEDAVFKNVEYNKITSLPFCDNFKHSKFTKFTIDPYYGELIISAHYENGKHWVVGFALEENSKKKASTGELMKDNWRYKNAVDYEQLSNS